MDFFRRIRGGSGRKSAPEDADRIATPTPVPGNCSSFGCLQTPVFGCDYLDATGRPCGTKWCREHLGSVTAQGTFCRRHDLVAQSLAQSSGSVIENQRPSREDRRFSLVVLLFLELN
ncbi:MAG TPA: hypothetical protein VG015_01995, partial [Candidatus Dormibacteraeota bacterium]|nr:hypothetical protein [Candidatus Dormibacteraeota bacterium]